MDGITRRDFLNGTALAIGATLVPPGAQAAAAAAYPPGIGGMRGSTDASYAAAHALRDGQRFDINKLASEDTVDLVVIGAGISGLTAAYLYRKRNPRARVVILDNHDDFGGHARRCEMQVDGRLILGYGGSEAIESPSHWSEEARGLIEEVGVDLAKFDSAFDRKLYPSLGLSRGVLFKKESFGVDKLVTGDPLRMAGDDVAPADLNARSAADFIADFPLSADSRRRLLALYTEPRNVLQGRTSHEQEALLKSISYREFLLKFWELDEAGANTFQKRTHDYFARGIEAVRAYSAAQTWFPGFTGLDLDPDPVPTEQEQYIHHFPDGNASIARLLVRQLIPRVARARTMEEIVTARFDYSALDLPGAPVRLRLGATAVALANNGALVDVGYVRDGVLKRVQARYAIHAGYQAMLPYMARELPAEQRHALSACVRSPLVYVTVAMRQWESWVKAGVHEVQNPMGFYSRIKLDYPVSLGTYRFANSPREPIGLHLVHVPVPGNTGQDQRTAARAGRAALQAMQFDEFERQAFDELSRILGSTFDPKRDVAAINVYRWGHGYAYAFNSLYGVETNPPLDHVARAKVGRISLANSDAGWSPSADTAIEQAIRAVGEISG